MSVVSVTSELRASPEAVWTHVTSMEGVNEELAPRVKMTAPREARGKSIADIVPGEEAFVSVLLGRHRVLRRRFGSP